MITTLYVGGLDDSATDNDIRSAFYAYGEIRNVTVVQKQGEQLWKAFNSGSIISVMCFQDVHLSSLPLVEPRRRRQMRHSTS